ncbi:MAG: hypothetical protein KAG34_12060 [Cocleimonas sp.]|nr:hypothetical protein [Cocleimonas sp.]
MNNNIPLINASSFSSNNKDQLQEVNNKLAQLHKLSDFQTKVSKSPELQKNVKLIRDLIKSLNPNENSTSKSHNLSGSSGKSKPINDKIQAEKSDSANSQSAEKSSDAIKESETSTPISPQLALDINRKKWSESTPNEYDMTFTRSCSHCFDAIARPVDLKIKDGKVIDARYSDTKEPVDGAALQNKVTMDSLFSTIQRAIDRGQKVEVTYDKTSGHPIDINIEEAHDEGGWESLAIRSFTSIMNHLQSLQLNLRDTMAQMVINSYDYNSYE